MKKPIIAFIHLSLALSIAPVSGAATTAQEIFQLDTTPLTNDSSAPVSYADVLEPARAAVVSVTTARIVEIMRRGGTNPLEEFLRRYYGMPPQTPQPRGEGDSIERRVPNGLGSGVIISSDGYILTNNHVVTDDNGNPADEISIQLSDGEEVDAELVGRDERTDIALVKIERDNLPYLRMADSNMLRVGDIVFAIGNPLGVGQTSTMGIVSATQRTNLGILGNQGYENFIQTDAAINRGNSGGALVDAKGRLMGINTPIFSQTGGSIGIGFAIPTRIIQTVALDLMESGTVRRGYLGVTIRDLTNELAEAFGAPSSNGVLIETVQDNSPASRAGIRRGDIVTSIDGVRLATVAELRLKVAAVRPGTEVTVELLRGGEAMELPVVIGNLDDPMAVVGPQESPLDGIAMQPVSPELRDQFRMDEERGVVVTEVSPRSRYSSALTPGMVILEVNDQPVDSIADLRQQLRSGAVNKLWISFRGNRGFIALRVD
jgi:serine protease Do/serine protease DegQ